MVDASHPFSADSPWNELIGAGPSYGTNSDLEDATLHNTALGTPWIGQNALGVYQASDSDPLVTWTYQSSEGFGTGGGGSITIRTPQSVQFLGGTDGWAVILNPDGKTFYEVWLGSHNTATNTYSAAYLVENSLDGTGFATVPGTSQGIRAAGASLLGGLVTTQELDNLNIPHAIALSISSQQALASQNANAQYIYPATLADSNSVSAYTGTIPIGTHFAIPADVDLSKIGLHSAEGLALATAYQKYGGYVVDTAGPVSTDIAYLEAGVSQTQFLNLISDVKTIEANLEVVTNAGSPTPPLTAAPSTINIGAAFTLDGGTSSAASVDFTAPSSTLTVASSLSSVAGGAISNPILNFSPGDTIDLAGIANADHAVYNPTSALLNIFSSSDTSLASLAMQGDYSKSAFSITNDGAGGTIVGVQSLTSLNQALDIRVAEDAYQGDAQFTVVADGKQLGGLYTAHASSSTGAYEDVIVPYAANPTSVSVNFVNDAWGGSSDKDRNLYVAQITAGGTTLTGASAVNTSGVTTGTAAELLSNGSLTFNLASSTLSSITLSVSEDAYLGDAQFDVLVDGKQVGGTYTATASHAAGQSQDVQVTGAFGDPNEIQVKFLNDAWGGDASKDRNLYVSALTVDGHVYAGSAGTNNSGQTVGTTAELANSNGYLTLTNQNLHWHG